ncbi:MAG TPA: pirin family protein [Acidimicrobiales bacterium]|nr:pirin family protein [Acidimicrobiales bacterium]
MSSPVRQTVPLGAQWPTIDPFLFCAHHRDDYPVGTDEMGPAASLAGRPIGQDFGGIDGWNMYHGSVVPGFPQHPHRGFETVTYVREGLVDHTDSMGATARYGRGDTQWLTAGAGIQHAEMFPLVDTEGPNPLHLFQIWVNLPAADKMVDPHFTMQWDHTQPRIVAKDAEGRRAEITVVAGTLDGQSAPPPPPSSWAARPEADVAIWHVRLEPDATWTLPAAAGADTVRTLYLFEGGPLVVAGHEVGPSTGAVVDASVALELVDGGEGTELLMLQGRPIGEPVAQYGPFVMNTKAEIARAFDDYQRTQFGGWPWADADPTHPRDRGRFARHADGTVEELDADAVG